MPPPGFMGGPPPPGAFRHPPMAFPDGNPEAQPKWILIIN